MELPAAVREKMLLALGLGLMVNASASQAAPSGSDSTAPAKQTDEQRFKTLKTRLLQAEQEERAKQASVKAQSDKEQSPAEINNARKAEEKVSLERKFAELKRRLNSKQSPKASSSVPAASETRPTGRAAQPVKAVAKTEDGTKTVGPKLKNPIDGPPCPACGRG